MPTPSFRQLTQIKTKEYIRGFILDIIGVAGFTVSSWDDFSFPMRAVNGVSALLFDSFLFNSDLAQNAFGETATDEVWQDVWGYDRFQLVRGPARKLTGVMVLEDHGGGPHSALAPGAIVVADDADSSLTWANTDVVTIPLNGTATVAVEASATGAKYNIPTGSRLRLVSDLPTVTAANPVQSGTATWITTSGADKESLQGFYRRCWLQWPELSVATPKNFYASKIRKAIPTVTKVRVRDDNPLGPGSARCVLATGAGPASGADVAAANSLLASIRSVGAGAIDAIAAAAVALPVGGIAYVKAESVAAARTGVATELARLQVETDIAGTVYAVEVIRIVKSQPGVRNFVPANGLVDTTAGDDEVVTLRHEITYVAE